MSNKLSLVLSALLFVVAIAATTEAAITQIDFRTQIRNLPFTDLRPAVTISTTSSSGSPCTTSAGIGGTCTSTFSIPGAAMADTSYSIQCNTTGSPTQGLPYIQSTTVASASTFNVVFVAATNSAAQASAITCTAVHP